MAALVLIAAAVTLWAGGSTPWKNGKPVSEYNPVNCNRSKPEQQRQKAFATAEGFGQYARGGRGGKVYFVTTLDDAGPGSLRECAEASGPRTCLFRVSGTIILSDWIKVTEPYLTIAGQSSPGGIALRVGQSPNSPLLIQAHDVIVRYLRLRPGPSQAPSTNVDTIQISGGAHDVILDHMSTSWPTDEGINIVGSGEKPNPCGETRNVTIQWSILSEGLNKSNRGAHSRGTYFGYGAQSVSFHHNLIASNVRRNPLVNMRGQFDMINNIIYNSVRYNAEFYTRFGALSINMIGNVGILGPSSKNNTQFYLANYFRDFPAPFNIYLKDNIDLHRPKNAGDERLVLDPNDWSYVRPAPVGPLSLPTAAITGPGQAYRDVIAFAGATRPARDAVDRRVIAELKECRGRIVDDPVEVGGWPELDGPEPPADRDEDGMADDWETAHGLSPDNGADGSRIAKDGYTYLEKYLGELAGDGLALRAGPGIDPDPTCGFTVSPAPPPPNIRISASPNPSAGPGNVRLTWKGEEIRSCKLAGQAVAKDGVMDVNPTKTTTYEISCIGPSDGDAIDSVTVEVSPRAKEKNPGPKVVAPSPR